MSRPPARSADTLRAGAQSNDQRALKAVGENKSFPHNHILLIFLRTKHPGGLLRQRQAD